MRVGIVTLLVCSLALTAFSLEKVSTVRSTGKTGRVTRKSSKMPSSSINLYSTPAENIGEGGEGDIIAAAPAVVAEASFMDKFWNDNTKLFTYLFVWYGGNIYCKFPCK